MTISAFVNGSRFGQRALAHDQARLLADSSEMTTAVNAIGAAGAAAAPA